jgi:eukaryotic-like serine/threonine-protein kinase
LARFALTPPPKRAPSSERFAAQLALSRVHPQLVAVERTAGGYAPPRESTRDWFDLQPKRGLAGYGLCRALRMLLDVLSGLTALEDTRTGAGQPFVHGELVPAMFRVDHSGVTRLIPLAPWHWSEPGTLPAPERRGHLAPERLLGDAVDARADVFSAGALLWEALAGRRLFESDSVESIVMQLMGGKVTLPQLPPELSWAVPLKAVAMCALSVDPEKRFGNCAELAEAIRAVAGKRLATHAELADYFGGPEPVTRPVISARPLSVATHQSSLSALVAPVSVQPPLPVEQRASEAVGGDSAAPKGRARRLLWGMAALSCLFGALGVSAVARYRAGQGVTHSAAQSAPPFGEPLSVAAPLIKVPPAPAPAPVPEALVETALVPVEPMKPSMPASESRAVPSKSPKSSHAAQGIAPQLRSPAKATRAPDRTAAKYGI